MNLPRTPRALALLLGLTLLLSTGSRAGLRFTDATAGSGIDYRNRCGDPGLQKRYLSESFGAGAAWLDYDGDGHLDLYVVNGSTYDRKPGEGEPNRLYRGDGKGKFTDVTDAAGVGHRGWSYGVTVGDYDADGDPDLYVTSFGPNVLYRNDGDGTFTDVTAKAGVGDPLFSSSAAWFDYDRDGHLDLYVGNYMVSDVGEIPAVGTPEAVEKGCTYKGIQVACGPLGEVPLQDTLYRNKGDGTFVDATEAAGVKLGKPRFTLGVVAGDLNGDGWIDLYVANDSVQNSLWRNQGDGTFKDVGLTSMSGYGADGNPQAGMGTDLGDYDGDGWLDIVVTNFAHDTNTVYRNMKGRMFLDETALRGMQVTYLALSWGTGFYDFDLDGDLDLFIANGHVYPQVDGYSIGTEYNQRNHLFRNDGPRFSEVGEKAGPGLALKKSFRGAAFADYDADGDVDIYLTAVDDTGVLLRNDSPREENHWLRVLLAGTKSHPDGVGARVDVQIGERKLHRQRKGGGSYLSGSDPHLHFGLGAAKKVDRITVTWPDGSTQTLTDVAADRTITLRQQ